MDSAEHSPRREQLDYTAREHDHDRLRQPADFLPQQANGHQQRRPTSSPLATDITSPRLDGDMPGYTLMVAGRRTGKTSFLRLLLDTSNFSPAATQDQLASVAKFVQGCSGFTSHIRTVSVNVDLAAADNEHPQAQTLTLTLIDTPALDFRDEDTAQRAVSEILMHVDARFSESIDDVSAPFYR